ncbi:alpha/beta hydrolase [Elioraea sp. Yellowstone]|jgi:pimeloyl-ACP methyl ester carboxylesterase|uniref:alpha/beta hydrolase n=1 Tax=Elioraea sp. Yellowstone TaxID=2592070 RepID=UPI00114FD7D2|nr:alpha/beta fold hydrolase [Elioraea sp. Yellowstone]TQF78039.1 alpha/beta hydrolase [Elioraea sp. Yellowstone]
MSEVIPFRRRAAPLPAPVRGLELLRMEAEDARPATVLFLHGAAGAAWMWAEHLMAALAASGWRTAALSFRGHGASAGRESLHGFGLIDYLVDARAAIAALGGPVVVVGHSLGGLVAQMLLGDPRIRGLVLLAPVPPEGLAGANWRLAFTDPVLWQEVARMPWADAAGTRPVRLRSALFSDALPDHLAWGYIARLQSESLRALAEAQWPRPVASARLVGVPALVLGAAEDPLVPRDALLRTAWLHGAEHATMDRLGHAMMLDAGWPRVAETILRFLAARVP